MGRRCRTVIIPFIAVVLAASCSSAPDSAVDGYADIASELELHDQSKASEVTVAVVDGGINAGHPSLRDVVIDQWSASSLPADKPSDHATQVGGLVAGEQSGAFKGGLAPRVKLLDARALDSNGLGRPRDIAAAITWAIGKEADIILTSLGTEVDDPELEGVVADAVDGGVILVASTGNGFGRFQQYPAAYPGVVGVTAHDQDSRILAFANTQNADFSAPGKDITAPSAGGGEVVVSGTSVAAAVAAGIIAACWEDTDVLEHTSSGDEEWFGPRIRSGGFSIPSLTCQSDNA